MGDLPLLKLVEVLGVLVAGAGVVWWQLRDVRRAQDASRRAREAQAQKDSEGASAPRDP